MGRDTIFSYFYYRMASNSEDLPADLPSFPLCKDDGTYAPLQCERGRCFCSSSRGVKLEMYEAKKGGEGPPSDCCKCNNQIGYIVLSLHLER